MKKDEDLDKAAMEAAVHDICEEDDFIWDESFLCDDEEIIYLEEYESYKYTNKGT